MAITILFVLGYIVVISVINFRITKTWNIEAVEEAKDVFLRRLDSEYYFGYKDYLARHTETFNNYYEILKFHKLIRYTFLFKSHTLKEILNLQDYLDQSLNLRDEHNEEYMTNEIKINKKFLNSIEKHPLADRQQRAVVCDEDHVQVVAGAGTGKTTTIIAKLLYLVKKRKIPGENILMLAYTRNAADEMKSRLTKLGDVFDIDTSNIHIKTFHSFGLSLIGKRKNLINLSQRDNLIDDLVCDLTEDEEAMSLLIQFVFSYSEPVADITCFDSIEEYYDYVRKVKKLTTLQGEVVKSMEELSIANYLYLNRINYQYETEYEYDTASQEYSQYQPDFYLPDYGIYLEHFGISKDEDGRLYSHFGEEYMEGYRWKLELHKSNDTCLVSSFSWENAYGCLLNNLKSKLAKHGVEFRPIPPEELKIEIMNGIKYCKLTEIFNTFLGQFKSIGYRYIDEIELEHNSDFTRSTIFLGLFEKVYENYENELGEMKKIDFDDMIRDATKMVQEENYINEYEYILIDEFQDISMGRYNLIRSLLDQKDDCKLFCVGDDWQSIFRFSGSYLDVFTNFEEYFPPYTEKIFLDKTYRFNKGIHEFSKFFIEENPAQLKKDLKTLDQRGEDVVDLIYADSGSSDYMRTILDDILNDIEEQGIEGDVVEVYYITRYRAGPFEDLWSNVKRYCINNFPANFSRQQNVKLYNHFSVKYPEKEQKELASFINKEFPLRIECGGKLLCIKFTTAHSAKGNEADYVIVDGVDHDYLRGFPSLRSEDPILIILLDNTDTFKHAEERRLFYVALTRTKNKLYLVSTENNSSYFFDRFLDEPR